MYDITEKAFRDVRGVVLEIGPGNGHLFQVLQNNQDITAWTGVEKNAQSCLFLRDKLDTLALNFKTKVVQADNLKGVEIHTVDVVIVRHVFCSIPSKEIPSLMKQVHRVLKPGGHLFFLEHVKWRDNPTFSCCCQTMCNPISTFFCDGCHLDRDTEDVLRGYDDLFEMEDCQYELYRKGVNVWVMPHLYGRMKSRRVLSRTAINDDSSEDDTVALETFPFAQIS